jgi:hypothetical protein
LTLPSLLSFIKIISKGKSLSMKSIWFFFFLVTLDMLLNFVGYSRTIYKIFMQVNKNKFLRSHKVLITSFFGEIVYDYFPLLWVIAIWEHVVKLIYIVFQGESYSFVTSYWWGFNSVCLTLSWIMPGGIWKSFQNGPNFVCIDWEN